MNRRKFMIGTGSIGAVAVGSTLLLSGSAAADSQAQFTADQIEGNSGTGDVQEIEVGADVTVTWENINADAANVSAVLEARPEDVDRAEEVTAESELEFQEISRTAVSENLDTGHQGEEAGITVADAGLINSHGQIGADYFDTENEGDEEEDSETIYNVTLRLKATVEDADGGTYDADDEDADLDVVITNLGGLAEASGTASGSAIMED